VKEEDRIKKQLIDESGLYRALYEESPSIYFTVDGDGKILSINRFGAEQLGYTVEELTGQPIFKIIYEDDKEIILQQMTSCLKYPECIATREFRKVRKDGTILWVKEAIRAIRVPGGGIVILIVCEDITDRKQAEDALRESEARYRNLYDELEIRVRERTAELARTNEALQAEIAERRRAEERIRFQTAVLSQVNDAVVAIDNNHRIIYWNKGAERLYNYKYKEVLGLPLEKVVHYRWLRAEDEKEAYDSLAATGSWCGAYIHIKKSGEEIYVEASIGVLTDKKGTAIGFISSMRDITERRRMEERLRESEERYRNLIELTTDIIYLSDKEGKKIFVNNAAYRILETTPEEMASQPWTKWVHPDDREITIKKFSEMIEQGIDTFSLENRLVSKSGKIINILHNVRLIKNERGEIIVIHGIARDITERKRIEEERERWTAELARSNAELEQFAYVASHDLQEPLRMVSGFIQLLAKRYRGKLDKSADEFIAFIVDGANRMQRMIEDLLAYSRIGTRGKPFEPTNMEDVFDKAVTNLKVAIEENKATVTHDPLPAVMADDLQMVQLFQNLISNGIKFRREEVPRIHISAKREENEWVFSVQDNGIGIAPEFFGHLFQIFQREYAATRYPGTGIGLAICKRIVERHGGRIWAESEVGRGSTFYFTIPVRKDI